MRHWLGTIVAVACGIGAALGTVSAEPPVHGRYVRVLLPGDQRTLSLAEVQVFSGSRNVALKCPTVQSSTGSGGDSARAVDGNTDGDWGHGSITHTEENVPDPAWEVDLGATRAIDRIVLWNRDGYEARLDDAEVLVLDESRRLVASGSLGKAGPGASAVPLRAPRGARSTKPVPRITAGSGGTRLATGKPGGSLGTAQSLRLAINDLISTFGPKYPKGAQFLRRLDALEAKTDSGQGAAELEALRREALLANPLLDFDKLVIVQRNGSGTGLPANWQGNSSLPKTGYDSQIAILSPLDQGEIKTLYQPASHEFVGDVDLHFDADRMLFSSIGANKAWAIFEIRSDGTALRQVTSNKDADIDYYNAAYLPNGQIICDSTSGYQGVPCVGGADYVANLHVMDADGTHIRRLTFEQDNDWYPTMLPNGRVLYLRWEYTDSAHYFSRVLMSMNPDGTDQKAFYGSNSYWPNSLFYARPVPQSTTKFVGVISGHHGVARMGEMVLFDTTLGRFEADGAVQRIPGYGKKVVAITKDQLVDGSWPKFLHPFPLSDKYFLASMLPVPGGRWGIYLVDVFDNLLLLKEVPGYSLYEPRPLRKTPRPPVVADRVNPRATEAVMFMTDVYAGPGLRNVPRGTVKTLRVYRYEYSPRNAGGHYEMGMEACWDAHLILGTVPVEADGSAMFRVPANTPLSIQPLDKDGHALQVMRSWTLGMPGEIVSCVGCHEPQNTAAPNYTALAARKGPVALTPWRGPARGFAFLREVQPVLDKHCVGCHDGKEPNTAKNQPNLADTSNWGRFPKSYMALHPYVRRNGPEGDYHLLTPLEFNADTSELVQMLTKGHHNVRLDDEGWDRLITWIDLNVPALGTWTEHGVNNQFMKRKAELAKLYANVQDDSEIVVNPYTRTETFVRPRPYAAPPPPPAVAGWPISAPAARRLQDELAVQGKTGPVAAMTALGEKKPQGQAPSMTLNLGDDVAIKLVHIPAGQFPMGSNAETPMERPVTAVRIAKPFWMGATEVTLQQYQQFDPKHVNGIYDRHYKDQVNRGYVMDSPNFPVIRVTWDEAIAFCKWLSAKTGKKVTLPTEAQWEWACRAGTASPLWFGDLNTDFSSFANFADAQIQKLAVSGVDPQPIPNPGKDVDFELRDERFDDGTLHLANVGHYQPNPWGLYDMHGNAAEWTRSAWWPYPYKDDDGRNAAADYDKRVVRGGSWHDRPFRSTSSFRLGYPHWQQVYHVGFRVIVEE